jgi:hypothetical protein
LLDVATDVVLDQEMLAYVDAATTNCTVANSAFAPFPWAIDCGYELPVKINFTTFAAQMEHELTQECYPSPAHLVQAEISAFLQRCNLILGCEYQASRHRCAMAATRPLAWFEALVVACFVVVVVKELGKVACVVWCLARNKGVVPLRLRLVVGSSPLVCLLALRREGRSRLLPDVVLADTGAEMQDIAAKFVYQVVLEDGPQFALALYYALAVTQTGVTQLQVLSMTVSCVSMLMPVKRILAQLWEKAAAQNAGAEAAAGVDQVVGGDGGGEGARGGEPGAGSAGETIGILGNEDHAKTVVLSMSQTYIFVLKG